MQDLSLFGLNFSLTSLAHKSLAALSLAISMWKFIPIAKKNENLGATSSTFNPAFSAALIYSRPSAKVNANSSLLSAPASYM